MTVAETSLQNCGYFAETHRGGPAIIEAAGDEWRSLCLESGASPFCRPEWITCYLRAFAREPVALISVRSEATRKLKAVLPMTAGHSRRYGIPVSLLRGTANDHSGRFDAVAVAGSERQAVLETLWAALKQIIGWDVIELPDVPYGGVSEALIAIASANGYSIGRRSSICSPYLQLRQTNAAADEIAAYGRKAHFRQNLRRRMRNAQSRWRDVQLHLETSATSAALETFYALEAKGWKGRAATAIASDACTARFYSEIARVTEEWQALRLYTLTFDGQPVAAHLGVSYDGCYYLLKVAYDEAYKEYSPGQLLTGAVLRDCEERGISTFDFLGPQMEWKNEWATNERPHSYLYVFNKTTRAALLDAVKFGVIPAVRGGMKKLSRLR